MDTIKKHVKAEAFETIKRNLDMHVSNKFTFREDQVRIYNEANFNGEDWSSKNMRRIYFSNCTFFNVNFRSTGFTGSIFKKCTFVNGNLNSTIFDECIFIDCVFKDMNLSSTSFCKAEFNQCIFELLDLDACFFTDSIFNDMKFKNCDISDIIWENANFVKCLFENTKLEKLNFEFTHFHDICFVNSAIPFASIPFIFGGINYLLNTNDSTYIQTIHPTYAEKKMPRKDYIDLLPDLLSFYEKTTNYFPVANILLSMEKFSEGIEAIKNGLNFWFRIYNYKMMYYLCELANVYNFSITQRMDIYKQIEKCNTIILENSNNNDESEKRWNKYQVRMRDCLLSPRSLPHITLDFKTSINATNYVTLSEFMQTVESLLIPKQCYYSMELRHNSPFDLLYTIFGDEQTLLNCVMSIVSILSVCNQVYGNWLNKKRLQSNDIPENVNQNVNEKVIPNITYVSYNFYNCNIDKMIIQDNHFIKQSIGCENPDSSGSSQ